MDFEVVGDITGIETIAAGSGIREIARLRKKYGRGRWRKRKGFAEVRLHSGESVRAEIHWYEATGFGRREFKIKAFLIESTYAKSSKATFHLSRQCRL
jgi:hypothetical protein